MARYRALGATGDYTFGQGAANFLVNSAAMVGQKVRTRLLLWQKEWFLDQTVGVPWSTQVLVKNSNPTYDFVIQQYILATDGVQSIVSYDIVFNGPTRKLGGSVTIMTIYSSEPVTVSL